MICKGGYLVVKGNQFWQAGLSPPNAMLALFFRCFSIPPKIIFFMNLPVSEMRLTGLLFLGFSFLPFFKTEAMSTHFQTARTSPVPDCSKIIEGRFGMTSAPENSQTNPIRFHRPVGILLEQEIPHKGQLGVNCSCSCGLPTQDTETPMVHHPC